MRTAIAALIMITSLKLVPGHVLAQTSDNRLSSLHMFDVLNGWAVTIDEWATYAANGAVRPILRTTDGGMMWKDVSPPFPASEANIGPVAFFLTPSIAWSPMSYGDISRRDIHVLFRTVDGGRTWRSARVSDFGINSIYFVDPQNGWLITDAVAFMGGGEEMNIYRSTDGGENWTRVASACDRSSPICKHTPDNENSGLPLGGRKSNMTFLNATTGWITGTIFYVTHDAGRTWREQKLPVPLAVARFWEVVYSRPTFFTMQEGIMPVYYASGQSASDTAFIVVYSTRDGGSTWMTTGPAPLDCRQTNCVRYRPSSFADMNNGWIKDGDALYRTRDSGRHWTAVRLPFLVDVRYLQFISPQVGWAVRERSPFLLKTLDGGRTWTPVTYTILRQ